MTLPIEIHFSTKLAITTRILARHVIDGVSRTSINRLVVLTGLDEGDEAEALAGVRRGEEERLAARGGKGVAEGSEDEDEEEEDEAEEGGGDEV